MFSQVFISMHQWTCNNHQHGHRSAISVIRHGFTQPTKYTQREGHIMPSFAKNLISLGKFCNAGCTVIFTNADVKMHNNSDAIVFQGPRELAGAKMWRFDLCPPMANCTNTTLQHSRVPTLIAMDEDEHPHLPHIP
jgi:hypothetical protein